MNKKRIAKALIFTLLLSAFTLTPGDIARAEQDQTDTNTSDHVHEYTETIIVKGSCTEDGEILMTCSCGDSYTVKQIAAGHFFGNWYVETPSTVDKSGVEYRTCYVCGEKEKRDMPKLTPTNTPTPAPTATATPKPTKTPTPVPTHKLNTVYKLTGANYEETLHFYKGYAPGGKGWKTVRTDYDYLISDGSYMEFFPYPKESFSDQLNKQTITDCYATWTDKSEYIYIITLYETYNFSTSNTRLSQKILAVPKDSWPRIRVLFEKEIPYMYTQNRFFENLYGITNAK
jgi:hypothetical protein